ncbi:MAG: response regulator [Candidatus Sulfobium sp.]
MRVLLVEDENNVAAFIKKGLEEEFYTVDVAEEGDDGFLMAVSNEYDLMIFDIMLPGMNGVELCRKLREKGVKKPVLMLTAIDSVESKVEGLESGADDFDPSTNIVDVHIKFLREKIDKGNDKVLIHTVRGAGYVLKSMDDK